MSKDLTRLSINLDRRTAEALDEVCQARDLSKTQAVRSAVALLQLVQQPGVKVMIEHDKVTRELVLIN